MQRADLLTTRNTGGYFSGDTVSSYTIVRFEVCFASILLGMIPGTLGACFVLDKPLPEEEGFSTRPTSKA